MLALLTNYLLDISFGIVLWTTKKTGSAIYQGVNYFFWKEEETEEKYILMTDFTKMLDTKNKEIFDLKKQLEIKD